MFARAFVALQYLLPRQWLTAVIYRVARIKVTAIKDMFIRAFIRLYDVDIAEIDQEIPRDFRNFNEFFTRQLASGARPIDANENAIISPVDGIISVASQLESQSMLQAKGIEYSLDELFAIDLDRTQAYTAGTFATIYLAPYNYHRVHMPVHGELVAAHYVPGDLFSVNDSTVAHVPGLFRRNERLNLHFETAHGSAALIFVGALNVGSITTPWTGEIRPRKSGSVEPQDLGHASRHLKKGDLLGWFNMGSTVILLMPSGVASWVEDLLPGKSVRMGEAIGAFANKLS